MADHDPDPFSQFHDFPDLDLDYFSNGGAGGDIGFDIDFSVDDLFVPDEITDPHPKSPESADSSSFSVVVNAGGVDDVSRIPSSSGETKIEIADVSPSPESKSREGVTTNPSSRKFESVCSGETKPAKRKIQRDDVTDSSSPNIRRKKIESDEDVTASPNSTLDKSHCSDEAISESAFTLGGGGSEEDEKRRARLMRNRESAQLSRQRRKHYVEELEDKVRAMNSTIAELNGKISFYMAENARLHHQLTGAPTNAPPAGAFPPPPMHFPWVPYPGYHMRPNGAHVPLVPIPRLKTQQPAPAPKTKKGSSEGKRKTKKVASVSLLGLLFLFLVFGGVMNLGFGGRSNFVGKDMTFSVSTQNKGSNSTNNVSQTKGNSSESIPASLYVPRNGKRVEINGNLIIHSVLASERAMAEAKSSEKAKDPSGLAISNSVASALAVPKSGSGMGRHPKAYGNAAERVRALASEHLESSPADGLLQQWFREGLAGPILSSGTCTEVFQFEVSPTSANPNGGVVPATSAINATEPASSNKTKNRRILYSNPIPLAGSTINETQNKNENFHANSTVPSMVVSVMVDPREAGDGEDGMVTPKSLSRIFVVVLMDSVKYVTYSCMLPLKSYGAHLVN